MQTTNNYFDFVITHFFMLLVFISGDVVPASQSLATKDASCSVSLVFSIVSSMQEVTIPFSDKHSSR